MQRDETDFKALVGAEIHGRYSASGTAYLYIHQNLGDQRRQGVELHEWVHSELLDNAAYGRFQQMLHLVTVRGPPGRFRDRCGELFEISMAACAVAHEGLAAYRELCWLCSNEDHQAAKDYIGKLPPEYREGIDQVSDLLGDPFDDPYQGLSPPAFHTLLITLGSALMNTPILAHYLDPERIFSERLDWLLVDGPDERLAAFHERGKSISDVFRTLARGPVQEATAAFLASNDMDALPRFWSLGIDALKQRHPDLPALTKTEVDQHVTAFNAAWVERLNMEAGQTVAKVEPDRQDISDERSLNMRVYPADYGQIGPGAAERDAIPVNFGSIRETAESLQAPGVAYLTLLAQLDPNPPLETFPTARIGLCGVPVRARSHPGTSPWDSSAHAVTSRTTIEEFIAETGSLADLGWCWYTNQGIVTFLREVGLWPGGVLFGRCSDAKHVLLGLEHARRHGTDVKGYFVKPGSGQESLVAAVLDDSVLFSVATFLGTSSFIDAMSALRQERLDDYAFQVGPHSVDMDTAARWMLWGAVGK